MDAKCTAQEAVSRALLIVGERGGQYLLGTGDYRPGALDKDSKLFVDRPWTMGPDGNRNRSDCAGFAICYCWKLTRHRPGYNQGSWASVSDDINCNSLIEDADHKQELASPVDALQLQVGDLITYPTFVLQGKTFIGHVGIITHVPGCYDPAKRNFEVLQVAQCHGPNGFRPGAVVTDGMLWRHHDDVWPLPQHHTRLIRVHERA